MNDMGATVGYNPGRFHHSALFYSGETGFLDGTLPFVDEAVATGEPILVAVSNARIALLRERLGGKAEHVHFADMHVLGRNPARIIPAWRRFLAERTPEEQPVRGIGEPIWAGRSSAELSECRRHEALLNVAFDGGRSWQLLCPYDVDALAPEVIEAARRTHPYVAEDGRSFPSEAYLHESHAPSPLHGVLPAPSSATTELKFAGNDLASVRGFVSHGAMTASLGSARTADLVLAVNELATNSVRHGGGTGTLRMWTEADALVCEIQDRGHISEPLVGRDPPATEQADGRGLWVVNHLCDLVQIRSSSMGNVVRVHMRTDNASPPPIEPRSGFQVDEASQPD